jgi:hypothetical protein
MGNYFDNCDHAEDEDFFDDKEETCPCCGAEDDRYCGCSGEDQVQARQEEIFDEIDESERGFFD